MAGARLLGRGAKGTTLGKQLLMNVGIPVGFSVAFQPKGEKFKAALNGIGIGVLTMGMSPGRVMLAQIASSAAPHLGDGVRVIANVQRSALESRTMAAVPFSYSTQSMDFVQANYQQARQTIDSNYAFVGNEAAFMAARFASR